MCCLWRFDVVFFVTRARGELSRWLTSLSGESRVVKVVILDLVVPGLDRSREILVSSSKVLSVLYYAWKVQPGVGRGQN
jgi:hypothetical protein